MRLTSMNRLFAFVLAAAALLTVPTFAYAQTAVGQSGQPDAFTDTSILKLPAGAKVAVYEWEDLECPMCARVHPTVVGAIDHYKIPFLRHDFLIPGHVWSPAAASTARYLEDKVSPAVAAQYRTDVFAAQVTIAGPDDLENFNRKWFPAHKLQVPFVVDPSGRFGLEVQADVNLGRRLGVRQTPTIVVVGPRGWVQVLDPNQLYHVIDATLAQSQGSAPHKAVAHKSSGQ